MCVFRAHFRWSYPGIQAFDMNGDGKVDKADAEEAFTQLEGRLTANMGPAAGGFGAGLLLGLRFG